MEDSKRELLEELGVNMDTAMERFMGNEALIIKFLKKFPDDKSFEQLEAAMAEKRYEDAFKAAHTLKGLCGNLSLDKMFKIVDVEVELLRSGQGEEAQTVHPNVVEEYNRVIALMAKL